VANNGDKKSGKYQNQEQKSDAWWREDKLWGLKARLIIEHVVGYMYTL
jgi:hypothetical protein